MKFLTALMLMLALGFSAVCSQRFEDELATHEAEDFMETLLNDDDDDFEIVDIDDALHKARILKAMARLVEEAQTTELGHPNKRFIGSFFRKIGHAISRAAKKIGDFFTRVWHTAKAAFQRITHLTSFEDAVNKMISFIHSGMTVALCRAALTAVASFVLGPAAPVVDGVAKPLCSAALSKLEEFAG